MGRRLRLEVAGGIFHVGSRGATRQVIFRDEEDWEFFLARLERVATRLRWKVHAYCLMSNHFHLIVETPEPNLGAGMHLLKMPVAKRFNRRHGGSGHVFEAPFWNSLIRSDWRYEWLLGYVAQNPVRAGLCAEPEKWRWSSFAAIVNGDATCVDVVRVLSRFEGREPDALAAYLESVHRHLPEKYAIPSRTRLALAA